MKCFDYKIKDNIGIHARPAGMLAKRAKDFVSSITVEKDGKSVNVTKLMQIMSLGVRCGDTIRVCAEGEDEKTAIEAMERFFSENL